MLGWQKKHCAGQMSVGQMVFDQKTVNQNFHISSKFFLLTNYDFLQFKQNIPTNMGIHKNILQTSYVHFGGARAAYHYNCHNILS
jgi:hypothetical protein